MTSVGEIVEVNRTILFQCNLVIANNRCWKVCISSISWQVSLAKLYFSVRIIFIESMGHYFHFTWSMTALQNPMGAWFSISCLTVRLLQIFSRSLVISSQLSSSVGFPHAYDLPGSFLRTFFKVQSASNLTLIQMMVGR